MKSRTFRLSLLVAFLLAIVWSPELVRTQSLSCPKGYPYKIYHFIVTIMYIGVTFDAPLDGYSVEESAGSIQVCVIVSGAVSSTFSVTLSTVSVTAQGIYNIATQIVLMPHKNLRTQNLPSSLPLLSC